VEKGAFELLSFLNVYLKLTRVIKQCEMNRMQIESTNVDLEMCNSNRTTVLAAAAAAAAAAAVCSATGSAADASKQPVYVYEHKLH
jgi:hypothetical protein